MNTTSVQGQKFLQDVIFLNYSAWTLEKAVEWIGANLSPEDVFSEADLKIWAENNNYIDVSREKE